MSDYFVVNNAQPLVCAYATLALLPAGTAGPSVSVPPQLVGQGYTLAKDWNFGTATGRNMSNAAALSAEFRPLFIYAGETLNHIGSEWQRFAASFGTGVNHVFASDHLSLVSTLSGGTEMSEGTIASGMLRSRFSAGGCFEFGYFEARLRIPPGHGMNHAFWLNPEDTVWPPEIDIMESPNNGTSYTLASARFNLHSAGWVDENPTYYRTATMSEVLSLDSSAYTPGFSLDGVWTTWGGLWGPDSMSWYVNNELQLTRPFTWIHNDSTDGKLAHVLISLSIGSPTAGSDWPGDPDNVADFPASYDIDFCRIWTNKPQWVLRTTAGAGTGSGTHAWPAGHQTADVALLVFETNAEDTVTLTSPNGFEQLAEITSGSGSAGTKLTLFWCRATSASMAAPAFADPGDHYNNAMYVWRFARDTGNPFVVLAQTALPLTSTPLLLPLTETGEDAPHNAEVIGVVAYHLDTQTKVLSSVSCTSRQIFNVIELREEAWDSGSGGGFGLFTGQASREPRLFVPPGPPSERGGGGRAAGRAAGRATARTSRPARVTYQPLTDDYWEAREAWLRRANKKT